MGKITADAFSDSFSLSLDNFSLICWNSDDSNNFFFEVEIGGTNEFEELEFLLSIFKGVWNWYVFFLLLILMKQRIYFELLFIYFSK